jgi:ribosomal protein S18 acetylase RimI-like enzyme
MVRIRPYRASDLDTLYDICLATGDAGADASHLYRDAKLLGHVYAGPYGVHAPETVLIAEDAAGAAGYIIGPSDTRAFEEVLEREWWPELRARYPDVESPTTPDERMQRLIHHPQRLPRRIVEAYPAHLHINLLPRAQGTGLGRRMVDAWRGRVGVPAHLAVGTRNARAVRFYRAYGFVELERFGEVIVFGVE